MSLQPAICFSGLVETREDLAFGRAGLTVQAGNLAGGAIDQTKIPLVLSQPHTSVHFEPGFQSAQHHARKPEIGHTPNNTDQLQASRERSMRFIRRLKIEPKCPGSFKATVGEFHATNRVTAGLVEHLAQLSRRYCGIDHLIEHTTSKQATSQSPAVSSWFEGRLSKLRLQTCSQSFPGNMRLDDIGVAFGHRLGHPLNGPIRIGDISADESASDHEQNQQPAHACPLQPASTGRLAAHHNHNLCAQEIHHSEAAR